jgi:16S rRNA (guanine966-N2)-methyltransferase
VTRIIAGRAGGRRLQVPASGTRPTSERVREALFSALEHRLDLGGAAVLDLFAGSGALGLEAVSRGAARAVLVEAARPAARVAAANAAACGLQARVVVDRAERAAARPLPGGPFTLVLADPPYAYPADALDRLVADLVAAGNLADDAVVVLERDARDPAPTWPATWPEPERRVYGDTAVYLAQAPRPDEAAGSAEAPNRVG